MGNNKPNYRETSLTFGHTVNEQGEADKNGVYSLVRIAENTFKVKNSDITAFSEEFSDAQSEAD